MTIESDNDLHGLRRAGRVVALAIEAMKAALQPGMTTAELLWAVRKVAEKLEVVGADVVEVIPTAVGSADITSLAAERIVREMLGGIALHKANGKERR